MTRLVVILLLLLGASMASCQAQRMVKSVADAKKLEVNKEQFIGKPLSTLLNQIEPRIKTALGNPENTRTGQVTTMLFYFVDKKEFLARDRKGEKPTSIGVMLRKPSTSIYPPASGDEPWTDEKAKIYGNMIVLRLWVSGSN